MTCASVSVYRSGPEIGATSLRKRACSTATMEEIVPSRTMAVCRAVVRRTTADRSANIVPTSSARMVEFVGKLPLIEINASVRMDSVVAVARSIIALIIATTEVDALSKKDTPSAAVRTARTEIVARIRTVRNYAAMVDSA